MSMSYVRVPAAAFDLSKAICTMREISTNPESNRLQLLYPTLLGMIRSIGNVLAYAILTLLEPTYYHLYRDREMVDQTFHNNLRDTMRSLAITVLLPFALFAPARWQDRLIPDTTVSEQASRISPWKRAISDQMANLNAESINFESALSRLQQRYEVLQAQCIEQHAGGRTCFLQQRVEETIQQEERASFAQQVHKLIQERDIRTVENREKTDRLKMFLSELAERLQLAQIRHHVPLWERLERGGRNAVEVEERIKSLSFLLRITMEVRDAIAAERDAIRRNANKYYTTKEGILIETTEQCARGQIAWDGFAELWEIHHEIKQTQGRAHATAL